MTPENICVDWLITREEAEVPDAGTTEKWRKMRREMAMDSCISNYRLYHKQPVAFDQGFDFIVKIDPLEPPCFVHLFSPLIRQDQIPLKL